MTYSAETPRAPTDELTSFVPTRTVTDRLPERRYVVAGTRAYCLGTTDGRFPPMGQHIRGLMGGVWAPPIKLLNGYWLALDGAWLPPATRFVSGPGYVQMDFPDADGVAVSRLEFVPDDLPVHLVGVRLHNHQAMGRSVHLTLEVQSEIRGAYPWDASQKKGKAPNKKDRAAAGEHPGSLSFHEPGKPWYVVVGAASDTLSRTTGDHYWGAATDAEQSEFRTKGRGTGGQLQWALALPGNTEVTFWLAFAGSSQGQTEAEQVFHYALTHAEQLFRAKVHERLGLLGYNQLLLPDDTLMEALTWAKWNMADLRRTVTQAQIRDVKAGTVFPEPLATVSQLSGVVDGYPDYANFYGTGSGYITYPLVAMGMWDEIHQHLRTLRTVSEHINGTSGKVVHEIVPDGTVFFGDRGAPGDINEIAEFASAVDLVWRWSGDVAFRDEMYDFVVAGMHYLMTELDGDQDGWPEGNGIAERPGIGIEAVDVAAATWQGLRALAHLATSTGDHETVQWASERAEMMEQAFDGAWWMAETSLYADSLAHPSDTASSTHHQHRQLQQRIWTSIIPMKVGLAPPIRAHVALDRLESATFTDDTGGFYLVGKGGEPDGQGVQRCWTVGTSTLALAEANYGRLAPHQALRAMAAVAACIDVEMPGAFPEIAPSPDYDPFMDLHDRFMVQQAWATYGISWTIIHNFLGIRPDVPEAALLVVPQIPPSWPGVAANKVRVGSGWVSVSATRDEQRYTTVVVAPPGWHLTIGHTLLAGSAIATVTLDNVAVPYHVVESPRGLEVQVVTDTATIRTLAITLK